MTFVLDFTIKQAEKHRGVHEDDKNKNLTVHECNDLSVVIYIYTHMHGNFAFVLLISLMFPLSLPSSHENVRQLWVFELAVII